MVRETLSLKEKIIAITRPQAQTEETAEIIRQKGGVPYFIPTIEIRDVSDLSPVNNFLRELEAGRVDYIIFMSVNGVKHLLKIAEKLKMLDTLKQEIQKSFVIAVGPRTAEELKANGIKVNLIPAQYTSESIVANLKSLDITNKTIFIPRTSAANPVLKEKLKERGAIVREIYVYESSVPTDKKIKEKFLQDARNGNIHALIFGSALSVKNLFNMFSDYISVEELRDLLNEKITIVAIGPVTAETAMKFGLKVELTPQTQLFDEAINSLAKHWNCN
ncbi:MAG: uroporphyrinogen-III synthase [Candidatus Bathyarchaeota archaeon]|nr:uroporphyrinogen-III synthase [Candidatus Bathyarchaeota archaeon]